jgi:hypothetical protein
MKMKHHGEWCFFEALGFDRRYVEAFLHATLEIAYGISAIPETSCRINLSHSVGGNTHENDDAITRVG